MKAKNVNYVVGLFISIVYNFEIGSKLMYRESGQIKR